MDSSYRDFKPWSWPSLQPNPDGVAWPTVPCVTQKVYIVLETWVTMTGVIENCLVPSGSTKIPSHQQLLRYVPVNWRFQVLISWAIPIALGKGPFARNGHTVQKAPSRDVAAARKLKANWFATQTGKQWKSMVNNELPLFKRTNQERRYERLLRYRLVGWETS